MRVHKNFLPFHQVVTRNGGVVAKNARNAKHLFTLETNCKQTKDASSYCTFFQQHTVAHTCTYVRSRTVATVSTTPRWSTGPPQLVEIGPNWSQFRNLFDARSVRCRKTDVLSNRTRRLNPGAPQTVGECPSGIQQRRSYEKVRYARNDDTTNTNSVSHRRHHQ